MVLNRYVIIVSRVSSTVTSTTSKSAPMLGTTTIGPSYSCAGCCSGGQLDSRFILLYPREELLQCARLQHFSAAIIILAHPVRNSDVNLGARQSRLISLR